MSRAVDSEPQVLTVTKAWSASPGEISSLRSVMPDRDGTGTVLHGYGQTIYARIDCRITLPAAGRIRFEYLETPSAVRRFSRVTRTVSRRSASR